MLLLDPPIVSLRLGLELGTDAIEEGKDVYFECKIKANPDIYKISWTHNVIFKLLMVQVKTCILQGNRIEERSSSEVSGLIMSGQSLVLQVYKARRIRDRTLKHLIAGCPAPPDGQLHVHCQQPGGGRPVQ